MKRVASTNVNLKLGPSEALSKTYKKTGQRIILEGKEHFDQNVAKRDMILRPEGIKIDPRRKAIFGCHLWINWAVSHRREGNGKRSGSSETCE